VIALYIMPSFEWFRYKHLVTFLRQEYSFNNNEFISITTYPTISNTITSRMTCWYKYVGNTLQLSISLLDCAGLLDLKQYYSYCVTTQPTMVSRRSKILS